MILPVPMPKKQRLLPVIFMSKDPHRKPVKVYIFSVVTVSKLILIVNSLKSRCMLLGVNCLLISEKCLWKFLQYMLRLPRDATVEILKKAVSELTGVHHRDVRAVILS